jgi:hypothetical protein
MSQGLTSALITANSIISAYSFSGGIITDLNTTNANNLTANGSAVATNADSPFGTQADGTISSTLDYAIIQKASFSTNTTVTVQVPEGCTIPTSGGVASVVYSSNKAPYGMPVQRGKWVIESLTKADETIAIGALNTWYPSTGGKLNVPLGEWRIIYRGTFEVSSTVGGSISGFVTLSDTAPIGGVNSYPMLTRILVLPSGQAAQAQSSAEGYFTVTTSTPFLLYGSIDSSPGVMAWKLRAAQGAITIAAENAYL